MTLLRRASLHLGALLLGALALVGAINPLPAPVVVVYPLTVTGDADREAGANLAVVFSTKLAQAGGLTVKPSAPGTVRSQFLEAARAAGADYYITGYVTPLGDDVSLISQVVSTNSGSVVFSNSALVRTYADAAAQVDILRQAILNHAGRALAAYDAPPAQPSASIEPNKNERNEANFGKLVPHHRRGAAPTPTPSPSPSSSPGALGANPASAARATGSPARPSASQPAVPVGGGPGVVAFSSSGATSAPGRGPQSLPTIAARPAPSAKAGPLATPGNAVQPAPAKASSQPTPKPRSLVVSVSGNADDAQRSYAASSLVGALQRAGVDAALLPVSATDAVAHAKDLCTANVHTTRLYVATLSLGHAQPGAPSGVELDLVAYDCSGNAIVREHSEAPGNIAKLNPAIDRAAQKAVDDLIRAHSAGRRGRPASS